MTSYRNLTAIVKTFLRDAYFFECIRSLRRYPDIHIIAVDDGRRTKEKDTFVKGHDIEYLTLPFDSGLPKGRNEALKRVKTDYVLIGDDDFYYNDCDISKLVDLMAVSDIAGGRVKQDGVVGNYQGWFVETQDKGLRWKALDVLPPWPEYKGIHYKPCHFIYNLFVAKKSVIEKVKWDERIKVAYEHSDFFLSCRGKANVVYTPDVIVTHKPTHIPVVSTKEYEAFRMRREDKEYFVKKWGYKYYEDMEGNRI